MLRFKSLGSGSSGNATLVESTHSGVSTRVLVDCGLSMTELRLQLAPEGLDLEDIQALFVTHEHSDHVGQAKQFGLKTGRPIIASQGTQLAIQVHSWGLNQDQIQCASDGETIQIGSLSLHPFTVPHDAREPLQLCLSDGQCKLGLVTDLGHVSSHVVRTLQNCHALILECNHDEQLLRLSKYPSFLKARISGPLGHLSNKDSAKLLQAVLHEKLQTVVAAHLSEKNNTPELATKALVEVIDRIESSVHQEGTERVKPQLIVADPQRGTPWIDVH